MELQNSARLGHVSVVPRLPAQIDSASRPRDDALPRSAVRRDALLAWAPLSERSLHFATFRNGGGLRAQNLMLAIFHGAVCIATLRAPWESPWFADTSLPLCRATLGVTPRDPVECPFWSSNRPAHPSCAIECEIQVRQFSKCDYLLNFRLFAGGFFALSCFFHSGNALFWSARYIAAVKDARNPYRWAEYALSATCMWICLAWPLGVTDIMLMVSGATLIFVTMLFGSLAEDANRPHPHKDQWAERDIVRRLKAHVMGWVPQVVAWYVMYFQFTGAPDVVPTYGISEREKPWWLEEIVFAQIAFFGSFGFVQLALICGDRPSRYIYGEYAYNALSLLSKGTLGAVLVLGTQLTQFKDDLIGSKNDSLLSLVNSLYGERLCQA